MRGHSYKEQSGHLPRIRDLKQGSVSQEEVLESNTPRLAFVLVFLAQCYLFLGKAKIRLNTSCRVFFFFPKAVLYNTVDTSHVEYLFNFKLLDIKQTSKLSPLVSLATLPVLNSHIWLAARLPYWTVRVRNISIVAESSGEQHCSKRRSPPSWKCWT